MSTGKDTGRKWYLSNDGTVGKGGSPVDVWEESLQADTDRRDDLGLGVSLAHPGPKHGEGQGRESGKALVLGLRRLRSH